MSEEPKKPDVDADELARRTGMEAEPEGAVTPTEKEAATPPADGESAEDISKQIEKQLEGGEDEGKGAGEHGREEHGQTRTDPDGGEKDAPPTPEAPTVDDLKDVPGELTGKARQAFISERIARRKEREQWNREREELQRKQAAPPATAAPSPANTPPAAPPPMNGTTLAEIMKMRRDAQRVTDGYDVPGMDAGKAAEVLRLSNVVLAGLDDEASLLEVVSMAQSGAMGERGAAILEEALRHLPVVQARMRQGTAQQAQRQEALKTHLGRIGEAINAQKERFPPLKDPKSPEYAFASTWIQENIGTQEKPGPLFGMAFQNPDRVPWIFDRMMKEFRAEAADKTAAELKVLKERKTRGEQPISGGGQPGGNAGAALPESKKIEQEILSRNPGLR